MTFSSTVRRGNEREVLERAGDPEAGDAVGRYREQVLAVEGDRARERAVDPAEAVEHRRLAGAVRPDEAHDLALVDREAQTVERDDAPEADRHVTYIEQPHVVRLPQSAPTMFPCPLRA